MFLVCFCTETPKSLAIRILNLILSTIILPPQALDPKAGDSQRAVKTLPPGLAVRASSIPSAGQGIFVLPLPRQGALRPLPGMQGR